MVWVRLVHKALGVTMVLVMLFPQVASASEMACARERFALQPAYIQTIAGSGIDGERNGKALSASFRQPVGVAQARNGDAYVVDSEAQNIRLIHHGYVTTFAGPSNSREAGFRNGALKTARFRDPRAIVVGRDDTIYVLDSGNHAIRRIRDGIVSTLAGSTEGMTDGIGRAAQFHDPRDLAIDGDDNLYVADRGVGIRRITNNGTVTTLDLAGNKDVCGVSASGSRQSLRLAYTDSSDIHMMYGGNHVRAPFVLDEDTQSESRVPITGACRLAIVGDDAVVVSDTQTSTVRFIRIPPGINGGNRAVTIKMLTRPGAYPGHADGPLGLATASQPQGIASSRGTILFSDTGNRRIREIVGLDTRTENSVSRGGFGGPPQNYRIAMFGTSLIFWNVLWAESIPGQIEYGLLRRKNEVGLGKCPSVAVARIDAATITSGINFIENYMGDGEDDLVMFFIAQSTLEDELVQHAGENWRSSVPSALRALQSKLSSNGTRLMIVLVPNGSAVGAEYAGSRGKSELEVARFGDLAQVVASSGVPNVSLLDPMKSPSAIGFQPLYVLDDRHMTPSGSTFVGRVLVQFLEAWRPWRR